MHRRSLLQLLLALALIRGGPLRAQLRPIEKLIPRAELQAQVAQRFPHTQAVAGELVTLELRNPRLALLPADDRIGTTIDLRLAAPLLGLAADGALVVDFRPRFEPRDRSIRMADVEVRALRLDAVPPEYRGWLDRNAPRLASKLLEDQLLYTLTDRDAAALAAFGWRIGQFRVVPDGLRVRLDPL